MPDYELKKALGKILNKRFHFGLYKGELEDCVYISPWPVKTAQLQELSAECGVLKRLVRGIVYWEEDTLVFASKNQPSSVWEKMIIKLFKKNRCATYLPIEMRKLSATMDDSGDPEEDEG